MEQIFDSTTVQFNNRLNDPCVNNIFLSTFHELTSWVSLYLGITCVCNTCWICIVAGVMWNCIVFEVREGNGRLCYLYQKIYTSFPQIEKSNFIHICSVSYGMMTCYSLPISIYYVKWCWHLVGLDLFVMVNLNMAVLRQQSCYFVC